MNHWITFNIRRRLLAIGSPYFIIENLGFKGMISRMKRNICYLSILTFVSSCQIYGITNDYDKLSNDERNLVKKIDSFSNTESRNIYEIDGQQLKNELKNHEKSIVYIFANGCSSEYCVTLPYLENYAKENGYKLYMIMSGYAFLFTTFEQSFTSPLYSINHAYYGTKYSSKCYRMFVNDITGKPIGDRIKGKDFASFFSIKMVYWIELHKSY